MLKGHETSNTDIVFEMDHIDSLRKNKERQEAFKATHEDENKDEEDKRYSIRFLFLDFCEYTSGHGPPRILASPQLIRKIFWTVLFLTALAVSMWQIGTLFETFKERPLSTHVAIKHETVRMPFAAIYV